MSAVRQDETGKRPAYLRLGLIGWPVAHSQSPSIHATAMEALNIRGEYQLYPVAPLPEGEPVLLSLLAKMRHGDLHGLNVTIPHKQAVFQYMDESSQTARRIGAVNTIISRDGKLRGDNTDAPGFLSDLERTLFSKPRVGERSEFGAGQRAVVLGAGGSARAVVYALVQTGWDVRVAARRIEQAQDLVSSLNITQAGGKLSALHLAENALASLGSEIDLVVNTTPLGMDTYPDVSPWPEEVALPGRAAVYDLVYNPPETRLLRAARKAGLPAANGLGMLIEQARLAFKAWTGVEPPRDLLHNQII